MQGFSEMSEGIPTVLGLDSSAEAFSLVRDRVMTKSFALLVDAGAVHSLLDGTLSRGVDGSGGLGAAREISERPDGSGAAAFVLFTSGSTGTPKGVVYDWDLIDWLIEDSLHQLARGDQHARTTAFTSPAYNAGFLRALLPLAGPSVLVIDPKQTPTSEILSKVVSHQIDQISFVPALLDSLFEECVRTKTRLDKVHTAYVFGEKLTWERVAKARRVISKNGTVIARYATTEAPGGVLNFEIPPELPLGEGLAPLGTPVYPERVKLVPIDRDSTAHQIAIGEPLAWGYLDAQMTSEKFVLDDDGRRWWLSGDLAEIDDDGVYHFKGRVDDVIKRRGVLISPLESEAVIKAIPGVKDVSVVPTPFSVADQKLVAHVVVAEGSILTSEQILGTVAAAIGQSKAPDWCVLHEKLPTTSRGKVDRNKLQEQSERKWLNPARRASSPLGKSVLRLFQTVLDKPSLGYDEDAWAAGLDSLSALEITTALEGLGFPQLTPSHFVEARTAAAVTGLLEGDKKPQLEPLVAFNPSGTEPALYVFPGAGTSAAAFYALSEAVGPECPVKIIEPKGLHGREHIYSTVDRHAMFNARVIQRDHSDGPINLVGHCAGGIIAYETAKLLASQGQTVRLALLNSLSAVPLSWQPISLRIRPSINRIFRSVRFRISKAVRIMRGQVPAPNYPLRPEGSHSSRIQRYALAGQALTEAAARYRFTPPTFPVLMLTDSPAAAETKLAPRSLAKVVTVLGSRANQLERGYVDEIAGHLSHFFSPLASRESPSS